MATGSGGMLKHAWRRGRMGMFATAITDEGEIIDVSRLTSMELEAGRVKWRGRIRLRVCDWPCYLRRSRRGLYHFAHAPHSGHKHPGMSEEHLTTQLQIAQLARVFGGLAELEYRVEGGVVDVLVASRGGTQWAFEVQLSPHDAAETGRRSQNYANQGLRSIWLMRRPAGDADETTLLLQWDSVEELSLPYEDGRTVSLASLVLSAVEDDLAYREEAVVPQAPTQFLGAPRRLGVHSPGGPSRKSDAPLAALVWSREGLHAAA